MNNLKRVLSTVLAETMLAGMMVVGASAADFSDADKIEHTDAVNTLVALNVINGKDDGTYDPEGIVTRAEMAKLITVTLNGGKDPVLGTKTVPTYSDIDGHWAESYIEYCSSLGVIGGRGDGTFDPNGTVTGTEAAKMMLVAMGWDSTIFNFTGADWAINVAVEANKVNLFEELKDINPSEGLTRDATAQLVYNGILAHIMEKEPSMTITNGEITWNYGLSTTKTLFTEKFGGQVWIGTFTGNKQTGAATTDGEIAVAGDLEDADTTGANYTPTTARFPAELDISNIGEEVKVLFKDGKSGKSGQPDKQDTIYGVFNTGATEIINAVKADIGDLKTTDQKIKISGTKYDVADSVIVVKNYNVTGKTNYTGSQLKGDSSNNSALTAALKATNGDTIKFVCDDNGDICAAYVVETTMNYVTAVNSSKITISGIGAISLADNDVYEGAKKNDIVVVTSMYAGDDKIYTVEKAEVVSGEVTGYKDASKVTVDGTVYSIYNGAALLSLSFTGDEITAFGKGHIGEDFELYLVNGYVRAAIKTSESASNYSVVIDSNNKTAGDKWDPLQIIVLDAEGAETTLTVDKDGATNIAIGDIITWTGSTGEALVKIEAEWVDGNDDGDSKTVNANSTFYSKSAKTVAGLATTSDCVLFAVTNGGSRNDVTADSTFKAYSIRSLGTITAPANGLRYTAVTDNDGKVVAVFANLAAKPAGATSNTVYGIVSGYTGTVEIGGTEYRRYTVESSDESYTVNVKKSGTDDTLTVGAVVSFDPSADDCYSSNKSFASAGTGIYVKEYDEADGTISYYTDVKGVDENGDGTNDYYEGVGSAITKAVDDDVTIIYVNTDDDVAGDEIGVNPFDTVAGKTNAILVVNGSDVVTAIIVETSGIGF